MPPPATITFLCRPDEVRTGSSTCAAGRAAALPARPPATSAAAAVPATFRASRRLTPARVRGMLTSMDWVDGW